jgi:hypothetical protein
MFHLIETLVASLIAAKLALVTVAAFMLSGYALINIRHINHADEAVNSDKSHILYPLPS